MKKLLKEIALGATLTAGLVSSLLFLSCKRKDQPAKTTESKSSIKSEKNRVIIKSLDSMLDSYRLLKKDMQKEESSITRPFLNSTDKTIDALVLIKNLKLQGGYMRVSQELEEKYGLLEKFDDPEHYKKVTAGLRNYGISVPQNAGVSLAAINFFTDEYPFNNALFIDYGNLVGFFAVKKEMMIVPGIKFYREIMESRKPFNFTKMSEFITSQEKIASALEEQDTPESLQKAIDCYRDMLDYGIRSPRIYNQLGILNIGLNRYDEAEAAFKDGLRTNPNSVEIRFNLDRVQRLRELIKE